jgi:trimeric autotransporter adhesin
MGGSCINIGNPIKSSFNAADVTGSWVIPDPAIAGTIWHPMAVKVQNNKIYVGGVTVKETTGKHNIADTANMRGVVYEFNPVTNLFTEVLRFPLSHRRGFSNNDYRYEFRNNYWSAWQNNGDISLTAPLRADMKASIVTPPPATWPSALYYAQPMLCNIEFDVDGSMILGIRDRFGDQGGYANYFETGNEPGETYRVISSGEVLKAGKSGSSWVLENNGSVTNNGVTTTTPGSTDNNPALVGTFAGYTTGDTPWGGDYGPGGGYFYYNHNFSLTGVPAPFNTPAVANANHYLKSNGGLAVYPGYNEVMATAMDPVNKGYSSGIIRNFNSGVNAGNMSARSELIVENPNDPSGFGKAGALGDLELLLDAEAMEIGNRVWDDANGNGIQDAHETGIQGVKVVLRSPGTDGVYGNIDDQTWSVITDAEGHYYFDATIVNDNRRPSSWLGVSATNSGILPGFEYRIEISIAQASLIGYHLTGANQTSNDAIDSDGSLSAGSVRYVVNPGGSTATASEFSNDYNVDFGFYATLLPLKQISLNAVLNDNIVRINWNTKEEFDVNKYHVERSADGITFKEIGAAGSKGNGSFGYELNDDVKAIAASVIYYRIRVEDMSGKTRYTDMVKVIPTKEVQFQVSPNPFADNLNIRVTNTKRTDAVIRISNATGQTVYSKAMILDKGANSVSLNNFQNFTRGIYIIEIRTDEKYISHKLLKQ